MFNSKVASAPKLAIPQLEVNEPVLQELADWLNPKSGK
jgi:hypothetical protein